jgi:hypothetical protein
MDNLQFDTTAESVLSIAKETKEGLSVASPVEKKLGDDVATATSEARGDSAGDSEDMIVDATDMVEDVALPSIEPVADPLFETETEATEKVSTIRGMTDQLQQLINGLATASLTREEVNVFEDMFMDAKEKLYGAARRGRPGS